MKIEGGPSSRGYNMVPRDADGVGERTDEVDREQINLKRVNDSVTSLIKAFSAAAGGENLPLLSTDETTVLIPRSPPSLWTRLKAALFDMPLLGRLSAVRIAKGAIDDLSQRTALANMLVRNGVLHAIRKEYGDHAGDAAYANLSAKPLTQRTVLRTLRSAVNSAHLQSKIEVPKEPLKSAMLEKAKSMTELSGVEWGIKSFPIDSFVFPVVQPEARMVQQQATVALPEPPEAPVGQSTQPRAHAELVKPGWATQPRNETRARQDVRVIEHCEKALRALVRVDPDQVEQRAVHLHDALRALIVDDGQNDQITWPLSRKDFEEVGKPLIEEMIAHRYYLR